MEPWAKRIRELLAESGGRLTEAGIANACKVKQPSVWQWFNPPAGKKTTKNIAAIHALRTAQYLGTTVDYILTGRGAKVASHDVGLDTSMLESAIVSVKEALREFGLELDAFVAAPMMAFAYRERLKHPREMTKNEYAEFDRAIASKLRGELGNEQEATRRPAVEGRARRTKAASA